MIRCTVDNVADLDTLLSIEDYKALIGA